jgi:light-regulated signal transduction histidine kinase (bacteriophytochrome)
MILAIEVTDKVLARKKIEDVVSVRTAALKQANDQLRKSNEELEQFAYIASHDMQEPLRKVSTFTELLEANLGTIDQKSEYYIDKIKSSSARMLNLIRDVLSYSQLDRQQRWEYVDLNTIVEGIRNDFELLIDQKQAVINAGPLPRVKAIPLQMSQLFSNLLSNALKFSKPGSAPVISITAREEEGSRLAAHALPNEDRTYYHIEVADNGIGFDPDKADQIFQIFQRLHGQTEYSGTGIGLALCRRIAQNHKGTIYATGEEGKGAVFHILLPA